MKTDLFQSCGHCWVFQICWHIECSTFRNWNSWAGIPSPPLALFVVMISQAHVTSHSRMSGSRWVIIPSWLSWSWECLILAAYFLHLEASGLPAYYPLTSIRVFSSESVLHIRWPKYWSYSFRTDLIYFHIIFLLDIWHKVKFINTIKIRLFKTFTVNSMISSF